MYINNIILHLCIIIYVQFVNAYDGYEKGLVLSKEEVLKITNEYYISFYCKNDTCVSTSYDYGDCTIEIPDENGNLVKYISESYRYENESEILRCVEHCTTDSQCLSNKCYDECCVFNDETPVVRCDNIYSPPMYFKERSSYMHCGKAWRDTCKTNDECSSNDCYNGKCLMQKDGPNEYEYIADGVSRFVVVITIIFIISICICCWCCFHKKSRIKK